MRPDEQALATSAFGGLSAGSLALVAIAAGMLFGKVEWVRRSE